LAIINYCCTKKIKNKFEICMDFRRLNIVTKKDPYLLPFYEEVLDEMAVMKSNNFWMDFSVITKSWSLDKYKTTFITDWVVFVWVVMFFGFKNYPPIYQHAMSIVFKDYFRMFMKLFLDDFNVFNNLDTHLPKLWLCFDKCK